MVVLVVVALAAAAAASAVWVQQWWVGGSKLNTMPQHHSQLSIFVCSQHFHAHVPLCCCFTLSSTANAIHGQRVPRLGRGIPPSDNQEQEFRAHRRRLVANKSFQSQ